MDQAWQESMAHQYVDGEIFTGNSKAAELMRSHPWSESTLGEPQTWPPSLKTTLGILLNAGCPMFCVWGRDRTLFYNDAAAALLGQGQHQTPAEALAEGWLTALHPDDAQMIEQTCAQAHQNQESVWLEYRLRRQDGTYRWVLDSAIPRFNDQGDCLGYIGSIIDIHDRKQTEMALRQQRVILEAVLRQAGDAIVVCNGKGQLTFVNREARRLAQLDPEDTAETVRLAAEAKAIPIYTHFDPAVGRVLGDSARLQQVIWNLLSNAVKFTPAGGRVEVRLEQVWGEGSQGARERESQGARELGRGEGFQVAGPRSQGEGFQVPGPRSQEEGFQVSGPRSQEEDSIGHPEPDTQNPELDTQYPTPDTRYPTYAQITVTDTGKGISTSFLPHVFEYFRQADSTTTRTFGGLGLGLAIVHYLVELHGGTVWADSPGEGQGATFTVHLPIIKDKKPEMTTAARAIPLLAQTSALQGVQLLLVDDDADTRDFLSVILEHQGARITTAASAQEALQALERSSFDLIISDIGMPNMDGYTLMQQIRGGITHQSRRVPAIALTAYAAESDRERALAAGFQQHLPKPVEVDQLIDIILKLTR